MISNKDIVVSANEALGQTPSIQAHGFIIVCDRHFRIVQVSRNILKLLADSGTPLNLDIDNKEPLQSVIGQQLDDLLCLDKQQRQQIINELESRQAIFIPLAPKSRIKSQHWECQSHQTQQWLVFEFSPKAAAENIPLSTINHQYHFNSLLELLQRSKDIEYFINHVAQSIRDLTQYDRVIIYRFHQDWTAEVIAESTTDNQKKYLGSHLPATQALSKIFTQYDKRTIQILVDSEREPVRLYPQRLPNGEILDHSQIGLAMVARSQVAMAEQMNATATVTNAVLCEGKLWGLVIGYHAEPKILPYNTQAELKAQCTVFAEILANKMRAQQRVQALNARQRYDQISTIVSTLTAKNGINQHTLKQIITAIQGHFNYTSVGIRLANLSAIYQADNTVDNQEAIFKEIEQRYNNQLAAKDAICITETDLLLNDPTNHLPKQLTTLPMAAGIGLVNLRCNEQAYIFVTKNEYIQNVNWLSKPSHTIDQNITPITVTGSDGSLMFWRETRRGLSKPWDEHEQTALVQLARTLETTWLQQENKRIQTDLEHNAFHDWLTNLPNRRLFKQDIQKLFKHDQLTHCHTLYLLDLDNFKSLNDLHGHDAGDLLLKKVANFLTQEYHQGHRIYRLGGDEFIILQENLCTYSSNKKAKQLAETYASSLADELYYHVLSNKKHHRLTSSIGIKVFNCQDDNANYILKQADIALHQCKNKGCNSHHLFVSSDEERINEEAQIDELISQALINNQFALNFQPQFDMQRNLVGCEALLRWNHPEKGSISPGMFIPIAEKNGKIIQVGHWVLRKACQQQKRWMDIYPDKPFKLSINCSAQQLCHPDFVIQLATILHNTEVAPESIILELTENILIRDREIAILTMEAAKFIGVNFSLDDFGTGYSSFSYLKNLPVSELKIDQSFIKDMCYDKQALNIVKGIIAVGKSLNMTLVAEGVETEEQFVALQRLKCDVVQGYYLAKPLHITEFENQFLTG